MGTQSLQWVLVPFNGVKMSSGIDFQVLRFAISFKLQHKIRFSLTHGKFAATTTRARGSSSLVLLCSLNSSATAEIL